MSRSEEELMPWYKRPGIILAIGSICSAVMILDYYVKVPGITDVSAELKNWVMVIGYFALLLGGALMTERVVRNAVKRRKEWYLGILTFVSLWTVALTNLIGGANNPIYLFFVEHFSTGGRNAMFALHGFFLVSAALRTFKMRTAMMVAAMLTMFVTILQQAPIGDAIWPGFETVGNWINKVVLTGGSRAIIMCGAIGAMLLGMRIILMYERRTFGFALRAEKRGARKEEG
jgi:hypothetical protein